MIYRVLSILMLMTASLSGATFNSDGSVSDIQSKHDSGANGDIITVPAGSFDWASTLNWTKAIWLQGAGAGRYVTRSESSVAIGTGTKVFTVESGLSIANGTTLRIERQGTIMSGGNPTGTRGFMVGTVDSYSGTTLTMTITSSGGSATQGLWVVTTIPSTIVTHNVAGALINVTENTSGNFRFSGIQFEDGTGTGVTIDWNRASSGQPGLVDGCTFISIDSHDVIDINSNKGVCWSNMFLAFGFSNARLAFHHKCIDETTSWTSASTIGANDTTGANNFYNENSYFSAWLNVADDDDNARAVHRYNKYDNAGNGTHGADTSNFGVRHTEYYNNTYYFTGFADGQTMNLNWWWYWRGGTHVVTDNVIPDISSTDYSNKPEFNVTVMNLQRNAGPNPCWHMDMVGVSKPAPRQFGYGRVTGAAGSDAITYIGDSEPVYIWNNTGTTVVSLSNYGTLEGDSCVGTTDSTSGYVSAGVEYFNDGTAKPGYTKYTYPHPLTGQGSGGGTALESKGRFKGKSIRRR